MMTSGHVRHIERSPSRGTYADIALPVAVDKTFTYLVPPELQRSAAVGSRAIVPFGRTYASGLIVGLPESSSLQSLRPIKDILDASPVVSDELLRLCRWMAEYYFTPLGEVLKAALPHGFPLSNKRLVRPLRSATADELRALRRRAPKRARILELVLEHGEMSSTDLQKRVGATTINAMLNEMAREGFLHMEEYIPPAQHRLKTKEFVLPVKSDDERLRLALQSLSPRKKKMGRLLSAVHSLKERAVEEIESRELLRSCGASSTVLRELKASGLVVAARRAISSQEDFGTEEQTRTIVLNPIQQTILDTLRTRLAAGRHATVLLHGVTGSGKTQVYIEAIRHCVLQGRSAIVLVPEISLTPQTVRRFKSHFAERVAVVHSRMSIAERHEVRRRALHGECAIVIGPRSAVFAPVQNLGLIVVDEEHEASYKQFDAVPRYNARDVAVVRGSYNNAVVVLGSATPSVESFFNAVSGKYELLEMPERVERVRMPDITIVDMTAERKREYLALKESLSGDREAQLKHFQQSSFSSLLREKIEDRLRRNEGIILLQNRRGFAPFVECSECGYTETCDNCNITLTYHLSKKHLRCHYCGLTRAPHTQCPQCGGVDLRLRGVGTQRVEQELAHLFPEARVMRMDLDTTSRKGAHDRLLRKFGDGEADILLGTQMVAKGLDFPRVTLVGVISADTQMLLPDFRSSERTFQLLTQVAGRAGRSALHGEVVIQTHQPDHYTLQHVVDHDFKAFYEQESEMRKELGYPPFSRLVLLEMKGRDEDAVRRQAEKFFRILETSNGASALLGPAPAVISKINNQFRWHIVMKNMKRTDPGGAHLRQALRKALGVFEQQRKRSVKLVIDVDPVGLM
jgi:primosomal protein N' (replication factor Y)